MLKFVSSLLLRINSIEGEEPVSYVDNFMKAFSARLRLLVNRMEGIGKPN